MLAAALPALLTGCAPDHRAEAAGPTPPAVTGTPQAPESGPAAMAALPLAAYQTAPEAARRLAELRTSLAVSCMHRAGFAAFTADPPAEESDTLPAGAWGYLDAGAAATQGFHPPTRPSAGASRTPDDNSDAYVTARVECDRRMADEFKPVDQPGTDLVNRLFAESLQATDRDTRVTTATRAWSDCMSRAGRPATDPATLLRRYRSAPAATPAELADAGADATCTAGTGLGGLYFAVLAGYQQQQIDRNTTTLSDHQQALKDDAARLAKLLAAG